MLFYRPQFIFTGSRLHASKSLDLFLKLSTRQRLPEVSVLKEFQDGGLVTVCNADNCDYIGPIRKKSTDTFLMYSSSADGLRMHKSQYAFFKCNFKSSDKLCLNYDNTYQRILGFGGAFTDATGINLASLNPKVADHILRSYFSEDGIEYNLCRVPIGCTDFSPRAYSYDDGFCDVALYNFKLQQEDLDFKIPYILAAKSLSKQKLRLFASAWAAPKWMKSNYSYVGGQIRRPMYQPWADYHGLFLNAYKDHGIKFWGITTGNEPSLSKFPFLFSRSNSIGWKPKDMGEWISVNLGPALAKFGHKIKIMAMDDQRTNLPGFVEKLFENDVAKSYIDGIAYHWYLDNLVTSRVLALTHYQFPDKFLLNTEACNGAFPIGRGVKLGCWARAENYAFSIIENLQNWGTGWIDWNLVLDSQGGPSYVNNFVDSPIIVDTKTGEVYKQPMFYALGHFSKFLPRGSIRVHIQNHECLDLVAFQRPDNGTSIVILNRNTKPVSLEIYEYEKGCMSVSVPPKSINSILYWR